MALLRSAVRSRLAPPNFSPSRIVEKLRLLLLPSLLLVLGSPCVRAGDLDALQGALDRGQPQEAYGMASKMLDTHEGDAAFDFLYGKSAYQSGHYHEAMFALERAVYGRPEDIRSRYFLALTYYAMGRLEAARREFRIVQANNPPADIAEDSSRHLLSLQKSGQQSSLIAQAEAFVGHDNNINRATGDHVVNFPQYSLSLLPDGRQQSDAYRQVGGNIQYYQPLQDDLGVILKGAVADKDFFSSSDFDESYYNGSATLSRTQQQDTYRLGANTQAYQVGGSTYSINRSLETSWYRESSEGQGLSAGLSLGENDYPGQGLFNVNQSALHAGVHRRYGSRFHSLSFMLVDENADHGSGDYNARNSRYWFYDFNMYVDTRNSLQSRLLYSETWRDGQDPVFSVNRDDDYLSLLLAWQWRYSASLMAITRLGISDNDSDIKVYEYERQYIETGVRYTF